MKGKMLNGALLAAAALALAGAKPVSMRLDVKGAPEGAKVFVDGAPCGTLQQSSTCSATQLEPGLHLLHVESPGHGPLYWPLDMYVQLSEAESFVTREVALKPMYGLVLVKSKPAGATVTYLGRDLGKTPLLIDRDLQCRAKPHTLELTLNGYRKTTVDVGVPNRTPVVLEPSLELDAGLLSCTTDPAGATVLVDGIEQEGAVTPTVVMVPQRGANLTFRLSGYKDEMRPVSVSAGKKESLHVQMRGISARLTVVTEPEKAKVYLDGNFQGKSPVPNITVDPGAHEIRAELSGYATATRRVELPNGGELTEKLVLENVLGRIEVSTDPIGAKVSLDGKRAGVTGSGESRILMIPNVEAGEHTVQVYLDGYLPQSKTVAVAAKETAQLPFTLRRDTTADTDVEKRDGSHVKGLFKRQDGKNLFLEMNNGYELPIPLENIRRATDIKSGMDILGSGVNSRLVTDPEKR